VQFSSPKIGEGREGYKCTILYLPPPDPLLFYEGEVNTMKTLWKIYRIVAVTCFSLVLLSTLIVLFFSLYRPRIDHADAIIVLGAAINTPALYNRSLEGLRLYQEGKASEMILSGGRISSTDISEAGYMQKVIKKNDPNPVVEVIDDQSHNTYENIKDSRELAGNLKSVIIVSDEYHLARGVLMAYREGFRPVYWSAPKPSYYKTTELAFYYIREIVALIAYIPKFIVG